MTRPYLISPMSSGQRDSAFQHKLRTLKTLTALANAIQDPEEELRDLLLGKSLKWA
jgi:hypothetical protein